MFVNIILSIIDIYIKKPFVSEGLLGGVLPAERKKRGRKGAMAVKPFAPPRKLSYLHQPLSIH